MNGPEATEWTAPAYLAADTYAGRQYVIGDAKSGNFTAGALARYIGAGNIMPLFVYQGHLKNGKKLFTRSRFYSDGHMLWGYDSAGQRVIGHSADRRIRILMK